MIPPSISEIAADAEWVDGADGTALRLYRLHGPISEGPVLLFGHANGFPSGSYGAFFEALGDDIDIISIPKLGHNSRYAIAPNWHGLGDELADSVRSQADGRPVIALGHTLGGMCSLIAAHRDPSLFKGIILMDPATINPVTGVLMAAMKVIGQIDRITPAGRSKGRCASWPSAQAMHDSLRHKGLFKAFSDDSFQCYMTHGLVFFAVAHCCFIATWLGWMLIYPKCCS